MIGPNKTSILLLLLFIRMRSTCTGLQKRRKIERHDSIQTYNLYKALLYILDFISFIDFFFKVCRVSSVFYLVLTLLFLKFHSTSFVHALFLCISIYCFHGCQVNNNCVCLLLLVVVICFYKTTMHKSQHQHITVSRFSTSLVV